MVETTTQEASYVQGLVARAKKAQRAIENHTQEQVDELVTAITWETAGNDAVVAELAAMALEETKLGDYDSKVAKIKGKPRGVLFDIKNEKTVGVIEEDKVKGLRKIAKPVGVIASLIPSTQPEMVTIVNAMFGLKGRNATVFAPHPRGKKTTLRTVEIMRATLKKYGAPEDLLICAEKPTVEMSGQIMNQCDLVVATGGAGMVTAAYSSGTPAFGVGAGNAIIVVDETADLKDAAEKIRLSKTFDLSAGCSCDNSLIINEAVYAPMIKELEAQGGHLVTAAEKAKLQKVIWPNWPADHMINRDIVAKPVAVIAEMAGIGAPEGCRFLLVPETGSGEQYPFSGEKMCLVLAVYKYKGIQDAIRIVNENQAYSGAGHSCGIYSFDDDHIIELALKTYTTRVVVRQPQSLTNTGSWNTGLPFTGSLGCGTWGGNIVSENIILKHYINTTWITTPIRKLMPSDDALFGDLRRR